MTPNQSLYKSNQLREYLRADYLQVIYSVFPYEVFEKYSLSGTRDRIYNNENTILTMIYSSTQTDKTLQNAVNIFSRYPCCKVHAHLNVTQISETGKVMD